MSPHCIYECENNLAQRLPADMEEKIIKCHRFVLRAQRRHDYQLSHILNMRLEQNSSRFNWEVFQILWNRECTRWLKDDAVWEEENEETEDAEEIIDNEFETDSEGEEGE